MEMRLLSGYLARMLENNIGPGRSFSARKSRTCFLLNHVVVFVDRQSEVCRISQPHHIIIIIINSSGLGTTRSSRSS